MSTLLRRMVITEIVLGAGLERIDIHLGSWIA